MSNIGGKRMNTVKYVIPQLITNNENINKAFRIAISDIVANILPYKDGLLSEPEEVIYAGLGYDKPWTRDAAINVWNCCGMLFPDCSKNTLLSVLTEDEYGLRVGGEYWDAVIWITGAWNYYLYTSDKDFLKTAYKASVNTIKYFEDTEFDDELNLFRGAACYGDGIAAYPDIYAKSGESGIVSFTEYFPEYKAKKGVGCPMHTLSTNCLYYSAYSIIPKMEKELNIQIHDVYIEKANKLKSSINKHFWLEDKGYYKYIVDDFGGCDYQEGLGHSFAILLGIADEVQTKKILKNQYITKEGISCLWPSFERYLNCGENEYGRHSGTIWPHVEAFWADAATKGGRGDLMQKEFECMTKRALRDGHFAEIYHPVTGQIYGGVQERWGKGIISWDSELKQTWSATGYIRMILFDIIGMKINEEGIKFEPNLISGLEYIELKNLTYRGDIINISIDSNNAFYEVN